jgi:hypothetical protein
MIGKGLSDGIGYTHRRAGLAGIGYQNFVGHFFFFSIKRFLINLHFTDRESLDLSHGFFWIHAAPSKKQSPFHADGAADR